MNDKKQHDKQHCGTGKCPRCHERNENSVAFLFTGMAPGWTLTVTDSDSRLWFQTTLARGSEVTGRLPVCEILTFQLDRTGSRSATGKFSAAQGLSLNLAKFTGAKPDTSEAKHIGWLETKPRTKVFVGDAPARFDVADLWLGSGSRKTNWLVIEEPRPSFYCRDEGVRDWPEFTPLDDAPTGEAGLIRTNLKPDPELNALLAAAKGPAGETADALRSEGCVWGGAGKDGTRYWEHERPIEFIYGKKVSGACCDTDAVFPGSTPYTGADATDYVASPELCADYRSRGLLTRGEPEPKKKCDLCKDPDCATPGDESTHQRLGRDLKADPPTYPGLTYVGTACGWRVHVGDEEARRKARHATAMWEGTDPELWTHSGPCGRLFRDGDDTDRGIAASAMVLAILDSWVNWTERVRDYDKPETWGNKTREQMEDPSTMGKNSEGAGEGSTSGNGASPASAGHPLTEVMATMVAAMKEGIAMVMDFGKRNRVWGEMMTERKLHEGGPILTCGEPGHVRLYLERLSEDRSKAIMQLIKAMGECNESAPEWPDPLTNRAETLSYRLDDARRALAFGWPLPPYLAAIRDAHQAIGIEREHQGKTGSASTYTEQSGALGASYGQLSTPVKVEGQAGPGWPKR